MSGLGPRRLVPEILDALPAGDPAAIRSRADLVRVNALMGQGRIMAGLLRRLGSRPPRRILEIGAGDGRFALGLARRLPDAWRGAELVLLDRLDLVPPERIAALDAAGWRARAVVCDVFAFLEDAGPGTVGPGRFDLAIANLFLHHFDDGDLARLLALLADRADVVAATEPRRAPFPHLASRLLGLVGANAVTRHDAPASVGAGFAGRELTALWPKDRPARIEEERRGLFTHAFLAAAIGAGA